jgi:uncharacterized protein (DUF433 family)
METRLKIDPNVCHGKPAVRGTRVLVSTILGALGAGDSIDDILEDYPNITKEDIEAALEFASQLSDYQISAYEAVA